MKTKELVRFLEKTTSVESELYSIFIDDNRIALNSGKHTWSRKTDAIRALANHIACHKYNSELRWLESINEIGKTEVGLWTKEWAIAEKLLESDRVEIRKVYSEG